MKLEDLIKLGLTEEQAKQVQDLHKSLIDGSYVPKVTFDAERQKVKDRDEIIADRDNQISQLGTFKGDAEALQKKVESLTQANEQAQKEYNDKIAQLEIESAIQLAVSDKVYSVGDILPKIDTAQLTLVDGKIISGLTEQIEALQKSSPHYFKNQTPPSDSSGEGNNGLPSGWSPFGNTPADGAGTSGASDTSEAFGKLLAQTTVQNGALMQKASETYFQ